MRSLTDDPRNAELQICLVPQGLSTLLGGLWSSSTRLKGSGVSSSEQDRIGQRIYNLVSVDRAGFLEQWFSILLMFGPFSMVHVAVTPTIKFFLLLPHSFNFATVMNCNVRLVSFDFKKSLNPQVENHSDLESQQMS